MLSLSDSVVGSHSTLMENTQNKPTAHAGSFHFAVAVAVLGNDGGTTTTTTTSSTAANCLVWLQATRKTVQLPRKTVTRNLFFSFLVPASDYRVRTERDERPR